MKKKLTQRKLKALIKDEKMATKEYASLGFKRLSHDEHRHAEFLIARAKNLKQLRKALREKEALNKKMYRKGYTYLGNGLWEKET